MCTEIITGKALEWKAYVSYDVAVDSNQDDKSKEIDLLSFKRPHMRAFHCSWFSSFLAFFIWFALAPLLPELKQSLYLTKEEVWFSSICSVAGAMFMHFLIGPICDKYGARIPMGAILIFVSIISALTGLVQNATQLAIVRFFIGFGGSSLVMCQYWISTMFTKETAGTASALVGGWGSLGGGVAQIVIGSVLFPLLKTKLNSDEAWRSVCLVPAVISFTFGLAILKICDDSPKGNYAELKKNGCLHYISATDSFYRAVLNVNTWVFFVQYACCFGVELTMNNAATLYFKEEFGQTTESAAALASILGWMNIFARGAGGFSSDIFNARFGMRGRLWVQMIFLAVEGALILTFANTKNLGLSISILIVFASFVQAAQGSTFGMVPYVDPPVTGSIAGIIGAGGNVGAICFGFAFHTLRYNQAFVLMGSAILASSLLSLLIFIKGHAGLVLGVDSQEMKAQWMNNRNGAYGIVGKEVQDTDSKI